MHKLKQIVKDNLTDASTGKSIDETTEKLFNEIDQHACILAPDHTAYQSLFKMDQDVELNFWLGGKIKNCKIHAVRFTEAKVKYDVAVLIERLVGKNEKWTVIKNVDSVCVTAPE